MPNLDTQLPKPCAIWWCVAYRKEGSQYCTVHHHNPEARTIGSPSGAYQGFDGRSEAAKQANR